MQEIVRQTPELKPAVYSLINRDIGSALTTIERVAPAQVPRRADAAAGQLGHGVQPRTGGHRESHGGR